MVNSSLVSKRSSLRRCRSALRTEAKLRLEVELRGSHCEPAGRVGSTRGVACSRQNGPVEQPSRASVLPVMACCYASRSVETASRDRRPSVGERRSVPDRVFQVLSRVSRPPGQGHSPQTAEMLSDTGLVEPRNRCAPRHRRVMVGRTHLEAPRDPAR